MSHPEAEDILLASVCYRQSFELKCGTQMDHVRVIIAAISYRGYLFKSNYWCLVLLRTKALVSWLTALCDSTIKKKNPVSVLDKTRPHRSGYDCWALHTGCPLFLMLGEVYLTDKVCSILQDTKGYLFSLEMTIALPTKCHGWEFPDRPDQLLCFSVLEEALHPAQRFFYSAVKIISYQVIMHYNQMHGHTTAHDCMKGSLKSWSPDQPELRTQPIIAWRFPKHSSSKLYTCYIITPEVKTSFC